MNEIASLCHAFSEEDYLLTANQPDNIFQIEILLKKIFRKGENSCLLFLDGLRTNGYGDQISALVLTNDDPVHVGYCFITTPIIRTHYHYICQHLQIATVLDMLFERNVISIDDHDRVQTKRTKQERRKELLDLLLSKCTTDWTYGFERTLRLTGHETLLEHLRYPNLITDQGFALLPGFRLGRTRPVLMSDFVARLTSNSHEVGQINAIVQADIDVKQQCLDAGVIEFWEGSIYFHLSTSSPNTVLSVLDDDGRIATCLQQLLQGNRSLLLQFSKDTIVKFELEEKPVDAFLGPSYGKTWMSNNEFHDIKPCLACSQATFRANYNTVLDEIEDDIIDDTLQRLNLLERNNSHLQKTKGCMLKKKTRYEKAVTFLQYALCNEDVLAEFRKAFAYRSLVDLKMEKCKICSGEEDELIPVISKKRVFHFTIKSDYMGEITIQHIDDKLMLPPITLRSITETPDIYRTLPSSKSTEEVSLLQNKYKIIMMGNTNGKTEFLKTAKGLYGKMLKFYQMPNRDRKYKTDDESKMRCIANFLGSSSDPIAFILISEKLPGLHKKIKRYIKYFGSDFKNFLILVFDTDFLDDNFVERSLQQNLPQCRQRYLLYNTKANDQDKKASIRYLVALLKKMQLENSRHYYYSDRYSVHTGEKVLKKNTSEIEEVLYSRLPEMVSKPEYDSC